MPERTAYIALGSNLGDRRGTLLRAVAALDAAPKTHVEAYSELYETQPVGGPEGQQNYYNGVVEVRTSLEPDELLEHLQQIERSLGRRREQEEHWGPRTCDLDILLMDEVVTDTEELTIPHPRMPRRWFVLVPLVEIAPDAWHPGRKKTAKELLDEMKELPH